MAVGQTSSYISVPVERSGLSGLNEGQRVSFDIARERGKTNAANLKLA